MVPTERLHIPSSDPRIPVAVLGATGAVGQRMVRMLAEHPWFRLAALTGSERSAGRPYAEAVNWFQEVPLPDDVAGLEVGGTTAVGEARIALSALDASVAGEAETAVAAAGVLVVSNARNHRMDPRVPLVIPEVNPGHLALLRLQDVPDGGGIITNPNCSTIGLTMALAPLDRAFGVEAVQVATLQAISGAGMPGIPALAIHDNVVPWIQGEEEKLETEPRKILGSLLPGTREGGPAVMGVQPAALALSAQCTRVPVTDGHTALVSVRFRRRGVTPEEAVARMKSFRGMPQERGLPSAPRQPLHVLEGDAGPQPRLHAGREGGMAVVVGRVRPCPLADLRMVVLSHNTVRGAAGGSLLCAELALAEGYLPGLSPPVPTDDR